LEQGTTCHKKSLQAVAGIHGKKTTNQCATSTWKMFYRGTINIQQILISNLINNALT
jgi:hypothetical protein